MKPDFLITGNTGMDDLIEAFEKGHTELYSLNTILNFLYDNGVPTLAEKLLIETLNRG